MFALVTMGLSASKLIDLLEKLGVKKFKVSAYDDLSLIWF